MAKALGEPREFANPDDINTKIREYILVNNSLDSLEAKRKALRDELFQYMDEEGYEDSKGNIQLDFDQPIEGAVRLEKQRRVTRKLDEEKAEELITAKSLGDKVYKTIRVIDEDALMAAHYEGELSEEDIDEMFPTTVIWALRIPKK